MYFSSNMLIPVDDLIQAYRRRQIIGAFLDSPELPSDVRRRARYERDQAMRELPAPDFASAPKTNWKAGEWKGKRAFLWKSWIALDPTMGLFGAQLTGDCVSWGERCKQDTMRCVDIQTKGKRFDYVKRQATCLLYSGRGHTGAGASPAGIANWSTKCGILLEVPDFKDSAGKNWDFSEYRNYVQVGMQYGRSGMPKAIIDVTAKNRVVSQSNVKTIEELCDLLINGKATSVGFSLDTAPAGNPISKLKGSTAHQTCIVGYDDTELGRAMVKKSLGYEDTAIFYDQSWGNWNKLTDVPEEWKPLGEGMYIHSGRDCQRHLNEREAFAASDVVGFEGKKINNLLL